VGVTPPSAWPRLDHQVSGLTPATVAGVAPGGRPVRTRFRCASASRLRLAADANSRTHYTKGTPSPAPSRGPGLRLLVGVRFQVCFTPLVGVLFTFPSRYWCAIGRQGVFRLGGWSPHVRAGFHVPRPTRGSTGALRLRGCHPLRRAVPGASASLRWTTGLLRVRSPLLPESRLMSSPPGTEMFQFPGFASARYGFTGGYPQRGGLPHSDMRGSTLARNSPRLIAACHVLHRLLAPRHPPDALVLLQIASTTAHTQDQTAPKTQALNGRRRKRTCRAHTLALTTQPIPDSPVKEHTSPHPCRSTGEAVSWKQPRRGTWPEPRAPHGCISMHAPTPNARRTHLAAHGREQDVGASRVASGARRPAGISRIGGDQDVSTSGGAALVLERR
jgi:hypothetical protein